MILSRPIWVCSVTPFTLSCACWPEVRRPASGWGSFWDSSSFVPWFILNTFRDASGVVPEWPWSSGFMRKSSSLASAPGIRFSVLLKSCDNFLWLFPQFPRKLELYSPPVIWEHLSLAPNYSWGVPHSFPYSKLLIFSCCELPFGEKSVLTSNKRLSFYCRVRLEVYSVSVRK